MARVSRIGKLPIKVSNDIKVDIKDTVITLTKGKDVRNYDFGSKVAVKFQNNEITVESVNPDDDEAVKFVGLHRSNINNLVFGLTNGFKVVVEYNGVGYKANVVKDILVLTLGYSHDIAVRIPANVNITLEKPNLIVINSIDKESAGGFASFLKSLRKVEPYKGKGVKLANETIIRKEGKKK